MNLLVIDWDFFFPNKLEGSVEDFAEHDDVLLYDWGHRENDLFVYALWPGRAMAFLKYGVELPKTSGEEIGFWKRFKFSKKAKLYYADSNAFAVHQDVGRDVDSVWLYDAHHDAGYDENAIARALDRDNPTVECGSWMIYYGIEGVELHVRYPRWKVRAFEAEPEPQLTLDRQMDDGEGPPVVFDTVFVCRSGAWTPSWIEEGFWGFLNDSPVKTHIQVQDFQKREFDLKAVEKLLETERMMWKEIDHPHNIIDGICAICGGNAEDLAV